MNPRDRRDEPVRHFGRKIAPEGGVLAIDTPAGHYVVALGQLVQKSHYICRVVLQIPVECDNDVARRKVNAGHHRGRLAEVATEVYDLEAGIPGRYSLEIGLGQIGAAIVDHDNLKFVLQFLQGSAETLVQGKYVVLHIDPDYEPAEMETRDVFGITFEQKRNTLVPGNNMLNNIPTANKILPENVRQDLIVALITLKYTQSNSICLTLDGQSIGIGAGQQSRIHCTRLAASKAENWYLRQHSAVLDLPWKQGMKRPDKANAIDLYLRDDLTPAEEKAWERLFEQVPRRLSPQEKEEWLKGLRGVTLGSDGLIPFRDNIDCASRYGVAYVVQPGGSLRDEEVITACNDYGMFMAFSEARLFHH